MLFIGSKCFGHYYAHHQDLATIILITTLVVSFLVCCRLQVRCGLFGVVSGLQDKARLLQLFHNRSIAAEPCCALCVWRTFNSLNDELKPIRHLLALLGTHHILHVSRIRVNNALCRGEKIYAANNLWTIFFQYILQSNSVTTSSKGTKKFGLCKECHCQRGVSSKWRKGISKQNTGLQTYYLIFFNVLHPEVFDTYLQ